MPFFSGFAGEFGRQLERSRADEADRAERSNALEASVLQHLATSPDPEIAAHGITGLLDLADSTKANKRASGLAGFLGKTAQHPALPTIRQLIQQGRQVEVPEHVPGAQIQPGLPGEVPGQAMDGEGRPQPPGGALAGAIPWSGGQATSAATPPPGPSGAPPQPIVAPGDVYTPPHTITVPRKVFDSPEEVAGKKTYLETQGKLTAEHEAWQQMSPEERQAAYLGHATPTVASYNDQGTLTITPKVAGPGGTPTVVPGVGKTARPTGPASQENQQVLDLIAANPTLTPEQAVLQVRQHAEAARIAKVGAAADAHQVRLGQIQAMIPATIAAWQKVNGTTPMTQAQAHSAATQALSAARQTLGIGPDVTPEDITTMAKGLLNFRNGPRGATVSPIRAALNQPLGGPAAAPPPGPDDLTATIPEHLRDASAHPRAYSAQGKQTLQAIGTTEPLLTKLVAAIKTAGLEKDNSIIGEQFNKILYNAGISPGDPETDRLFTEGVSRAYGMRGLVGGRSNQVLQKLYGQHLVDPGDSPQLVLQKAQDLLEILPDIRKAVDDSEAAQVGARGKGKAPAAGPPAPSTAAPGGIPEAVKAALKGVPAGKHTLSDHSVWVVDAAGNISPGK